ncbi:MAG: sodium:proton antiporter NhaD [Bacteroidales bacterium]
MVALMGVLFVAGYVLISLEHQIKINKAATALVVSMVLWTLYILAAPVIVPNLGLSDFNFYLTENPGLQSLSLKEQVIDYVVNVQLLEHVGDVGEIIFFLMGAMTVVELIDVHSGFSIITDRITTKNKKKLLWLLAGITFFLSAVIDNLTTAIVMVALLNKIVPDKTERWWFASILILAANSGGAWSPIGDVTTILLWVKGTVTPVRLMEYVLLPSIVSVLIPLVIVSRNMKGEVTMLPEGLKVPKKTHEQVVGYRQKLTILILGIGGLLSVPVYKSLTHMPPFTGVMLVLGLLWMITDYMYRKMPDDIPFHLRVSTLIKRIDIPTLLFFMGILMSVAALQAAGGLTAASYFLEEHFKNVYVINMLIGVLSAVVDNVPLVAAALGLYPIADPATLSTMADPGFMSYFVQDGIYWHFLTYCAGVGGSLLIIGSAAGVVVMGIEKIHFTWYLKKISWLALIGYLAGAAVFILEVFLMQGKL